MEAPPAARVMEKEAAAPAQEGMRGEPVAGGTSGRHGKAEQPGRNANTAAAAPAAAELRLKARARRLGSAQDGCQDSQRPPCLHPSRTVPKPHQPLQGVWVRQVRGDATGGSGGGHGLSKPGGICHHSQGSSKVHASLGQVST